MEGVTSSFLRYKRMVSNVIFIMINERFSLCTSDGATAAGTSGQDEVEILHRLLVSAEKDLLPK